MGGTGGGDDVELKRRPHLALPCLPDRNKSGGILKTTRHRHAQRTLTHGTVGRMHACPPFGRKALISVFLVFVIEHPT